MISDGLVGTRRLADPQIHAAAKTSLSSSYWSSEPGNAGALSHIWIHIRCLRFLMTADSIKFEDCKAFIRLSSGIHSKHFSAITQGCQTDYMSDLASPNAPDFLVIMLSAYANLTSSRDLVISFQHSGTPSELGA